MASRGKIKIEIAFFPHCPTLRENFMTTKLDAKKSRYGFKNLKKRIAAVTVFSAQI